MNNLVSAIIPTYNRKTKFLHQAVTSVRNQSYKFIEIIVINDNCFNSDIYNEIKEYCLCYSDIKYLETNHSGACFARNLAASHAQGSYLAFLDDDDVWLPDKISLQLKSFSPNTGLVYSNGYWVYTDHIPIERKPYRKPEKFHENITFEELLIQNHIGTTSQIIVKKNCFFECGKFDERFVARHDYDFCLRMSKRYELIGNPNFLFEHYYHSEEQIIKNNKKSLIGYQLLYHTYLHDYNHNPIAKSNICCKISRAAYNEKQYILWMKYLFLSIINQPSNIKKIFKQSIDGKTF